MSPSWVELGCRPALRSSLFTEQFPVGAKVSVLRRWTMAPHGRTYMCSIRNNSLASKETAFHVSSAPVASTLAVVQLPWCRDSMSSCFVRAQPGSRRHGVVFSVVPGESKTLVAPVTLRTKRRVTLPPHLEMNGTVPLLGHHRRVLMYWLMQARCRRLCPW